MARPVSKSDEAEVPVVLMRKIGPERFEVVTGLLKGTLRDVKVLEKNVTLAVGRSTARAAIDKQAVIRKAAFGLEGGN